MAEPLPPKPPRVFCALPTRVPAEDAAIYQQLRQFHCDDKRPGHECQGRVTLDRNDITLSCPRCGDHRSLFPPAEDSDG